MKINSKSVRLIVLSFWGLSVGMALAGCGSGNEVVKEDPAVTAKRVDAAKDIRSYFDKSHGNYDALSAEDKEALNKLTGSEANSHTAFGHMGAPGGGPSTGGGLPPSGPGGAGGGVPPSGTGKD